MEVKPKKAAFSINKKNVQTMRKSTRSIAHSQKEIEQISYLHSTLLFTNKITPNMYNYTSRANSYKYSSKRRQQAGSSTTCWCLYDEKSKRQLGFRQNYQRQVASLTKIMTTIVGLQLKKKFDLSANLTISITESSTKHIGTSAHLKPKYWILLKDLFYGIMLPSGNDASYLLAQVLGYLICQSKKAEHFYPKYLESLDLSFENTSLYVTQFVRVMNSKAQQLGLSMSRFSNPHGLQNAMNTSTAKDILTLSMYASKNNKFKEIMNTQAHRYYLFTSTEKNKKQMRVWQNTNILLREGWEGVKTGQTVSAGNCLSSLKNGIYIVVLNCPDSLKRFTQTKRLYNWYCENQKNLGSTLSSSTQSFQF